MVLIRFKSTPENFRKEYLGLKRNTIRKEPEQEDIRFSYLRDFINGSLQIIDIEITDTYSSESFTRTVTDVTYYEGWYIISW